jgi:hypothetical protein
LIINNFLFNLNSEKVDKSGSISHDAMKTKVLKKYDVFDSEQKKIDAAQADKEDNDAVDKLIQASKKK